MDDDAFGAGVRRLDPEFAKERKFLAGCAGADGEPARRKAVALAAAEKAIIARAEKRDHLVHHMRRVERIMQAEAGEAEIDRQRAGDLVVAVVEKIGGVGDRRGQAVAQDVDRHRPLVEMAEVKQFEPEGAARLSQQRLVGFEADVAPGVEIEMGDAVGQRRDRRVERRAGQVARALDDIVIAERGRRFGGLGVLLRQSGPARRQAGRGGDSGKQRATIDILHEVRSTEKRWGEL